MDHQEQLQEYRDDLGRHLVAYLNSQGIIPNNAGLVKCINPSHSDDQASMRVTRPHENSLWCYGCRASYDIFGAASVLENKPIDGKGFITDNLNYLAAQFGMPELEIELTPEDEKEISSDRLHRMAISLFRKYMTFDTAHARGWTDDKMLEGLSIGTVVEREKMFHELAALTGLTMDEILELGVEQRFFGADKLTFALFNPRGECVGFSSRNLKHEEMVEQGMKSQKYLNPSHDRNPLYRKNSYVYNLHRARNKNKVEMAIQVEGYADVVALETHGIRGGVAVGGVAFDVKQAAAMVKAGIRDVVLAFDYDGREGKNRAGQDGIISAFKVWRAYPDVRVRVIDWTHIVKETVGDNDKYDIDHLLKEKGSDYVRNCLRKAIPPVAFKIRELIDRGMERREVVTEIVPDIARIQDEILIQEYTETLADETEYDFELLLSKVKREMRNINRDTNNEIDDILKGAYRDYGRVDDVPSKIDILSSAVLQMQSLDTRGDTSSVTTDMAAIETFEKEADGEIDAPVARTGLKYLDDDLGGGIPLEGKILLHAGRPHVGKTMLQQRLTVGVLENNPNVDVLVWTLDDDARSWYQRIWSCVSGIPIYRCMRPAHYMKDNPQEIARYNKARDKVRGWVSTGRLEIRDAAGGNHISVLENLIKNKRKKSNRPLIVFFDNLHKTAGSSDRQKLEETAGRTKFIGQNQKVTIIANAELRKRDQAGVEFPKPPSEDDLKETGKLHYDADYIVLLDSPMQRMPYRPDVINPKNGKPYISYKELPNTCWQKTNGMQDLPILHLLRCKNKIFNITGEVEQRFNLEYDSQLVQFRDAGEWGPTSSSAIPDDFGTSERNVI